MKTAWKKLLTLMLAAALVCMAASALADASEIAQKSFGGDFDPNSENLEGWQKLLVDWRNDMSEYKEKYAPQVRTLKNGVQIQRTPAVGESRNNIKVYHADQRGCAACHTDLGETVNNLNSRGELGNWDGFFYGHHDLTNKMGIEITYLQCLSCHNDSLRAEEFSSIMHATHRNSAAFEALGGDCWSCHFVDEETGDFVFWDAVKYDVLHGITDVANVQGEFSYDQDVTTEEVFTLNQRYVWNLKDNAGAVPDPENDGVYDQYEITVNGLVENPVTYTLRELIETAPSVTDIGTFACEINSYGGPFISSFEFTGIPVTWLFEQSVPTAEANGFKNEFWGGPWSFEYLEMFPSYLVYEINGEPLSYKDGYPVMLYNMNGGAGKCIKNLTNIELIHIDDPMAYYDVTFDAGKKRDYASESLMHHPNVGLCNLPDGLIIPAGEPHTFEGYAHGYHWGIDAIEFSMDGGKTWTRFDTTDSEEGKWLYWNFTWTPEKTGSYVLSVRAYDRIGRTFDVPNEKLFNVQ